MTAQEKTLTQIEKLEVIAEYFTKKSDAEFEWCKNQRDLEREADRDTKWAETAMERERSRWCAYHDMLEAIRLYK